ncbi:glutamate-ammonia-ligase adenylyltransferase [Streptoalloteichus tenebrarius]|uniref:Bifunctional glutamine synthetase adenylyltransferase/adenylyl-removing enzyme n=1 Tax=Streptoalloteichus tenebrarius (strain ATCC 17920 / DSM 40477 / JCM 4838 / CBS 697.72 / NBRC 16177 / NCIMB 11028 / NRRL B-12390 / A12253. 1 / ISP 5477) TaxID=1933 RepID=A0ABT1I3R2_STRSD|nr:bifunctional [glutamine synthetase] adenylyltransferase/[glutamine synthetase]-adenylyl-L-tyrosine phosphorylase [Streptoalloteichus tenebrarius]MCP2262361.1 glutamate-ammonia-ligase adenylyltransferase [Streptoalloteichus tenebrarius]BFF00638.1 bifunctional [glutamine synthetase] adenylyltransferase/[glutamine synthetase]-adenylyl-L-tyrosine phosphorylase [Streptoalloteichus tenebrarius]
MAVSGRGPVLSPARFGLTDPRAERELCALGWWTDGGPMPGAQWLLSALARSPDPDMALRGLERLRDALGGGWAELDAALRKDTALRGRLLAVLGSSTALTDHLVVRPEEWRRLVGEASPTDVGHFTAALLAAVGAEETTGRPGVVRARSRGQEAVRALRGAYRGLLLGIAAADLAPVVEPSLPELGYDAVAGALSDLAVAALRASLAVAVAEVVGEDEPLTVRLAVIAMGKCGGRELNYVSDVDVVFVAEPDAELAVATKVASAMMRVAGDACFEVDAALRPEGKAGALVRTLDGHLSYYRRWARTWEFQALLKARPVAGDLELGERYVAALRPMVWAAADREGFVADVQAMRRRVENNVPAELSDRELKLGRGGLRDVEFAVQLLQLVHGRTDEELRSAATVEALAALGRGGYVGRADAADLGESYRFLRLLEHRLQLRRLRRTHLFPADDDQAGLRWLARAAGVRPDGRRSAGEVLLAEFRRHSNRVRRLHEKLFYRPLLEAVARVPSEALRLTPAAARQRLSALGYTSPEGALRHIQALTSGVSRRAAIQGALLPVLLDLLASTPDPDGGLLAYRRVSEALAETPWYLRLLRDEGAVAERLAALLGISRYVPDLLVRAPEVLRLLADTTSLAGRDPEEAAGSLRSAVARHADPEQAVLAARSLRRHELLRVACADLLGLLDLPGVCTALSTVWVAVLGAALDAAGRSVLQGEAPPARVAVIGMGRLGGAELGYGSDADVMFVCEPVDGADERSAVRYATAVAELVRRLLSAPSLDPPLQVDTDLRPEGRSGPLVRTLDSYRAYYGQWAEVWEAQALLRARFVAGDEELGARFVASVDPVRYPEGGLEPAMEREIRRIKARVDAERLPRGADPATHTKLGRGGLADVEWTVQLLQLRHAHAFPGLRTTSTVAGLEAARDAGLLDAADADALAAGWRMATRARNAVTLVRGKPADQLPGSGRELAAVARALGYPASADPGEFVDDYRRTTRRARGVVERIFYGQ